MTGGQADMIGDGWCILRTAGPRTIPLANSLAKAGYEVWTPRAVHVRRRPRSTIVRDVEAPILPTFVFAKADRIRDLARLAATVSSLHPPFSLFRYVDKFPIIAGDEMATIKAAEVEAQKKYDAVLADRARREAARLRNQKIRDRRHFDRGQAVQPEGRAFAGVTGIVEEEDGKFAMVNFGGSVRWKIGTWLLESDAVEGAQPKTGAAA